MTANVLSEQQLSLEELEQGRLFLRQTHNAVIGATKGLSAAQWQFKPAPGRWSAAETLDHIVTVQERVLGAILPELLKAPAPPATRNVAGADAIVIHHFGTRLKKFPAPEFVQPTGASAPATLLERLETNRARLKDCLESTPGLRQHAAEAAPMRAVSNGVYEQMDGYQWILAAAAHAERHAKQILELKADDRFPAA